MPPPRLPGQYPQGPLEQAAERTQRLRAERGNPEVLRPRELCEDEAGDLWYRSANGRLYKLTGIPLPDAAYQIAQAINAQGAGGAGVTGAAGADGATGPTGTAGLKWRGTWAPGVAYAVGDAVFHSSSRASYICITANTSQTPASGAYWNYLAPPGTPGATGPTGPAGTGPVGPAGPVGARYVGAWLPAVEYAVGDIVIDYEEPRIPPAEYPWTVPYICRITHLSSLSTRPGQSPGWETYWGVLMISPM